MNKAVVFYRSRTGTTKYFGEGIDKFLNEPGIETKVYSVYDFNSEQIAEIGQCWTHRLFIVLQHPDKDWFEFVKKLPELNDKKLVLFATYKLATGNMFKKMEKHLPGKISNVQAYIKSKSDKLSGEHKKQILDCLQFLSTYWHISNQKFDYYVVNRNNNLLKSI